jgi:hypothetical protein
MRDSDRRPGFRAGLRISAALGMAVFVMLVAAPSRPGAVAWAQSNPVPLINQPLVPDAVAPGGQSFTLTVNGTGFVPGSVVQWTGTALATTFLSAAQLTASVPASDIAAAGTASVRVVNPGVGAASNVAFFQVIGSSSTVTFGNASVATASGPEDVTVADFNGDGKLDLAVCNILAGELSIMLGNGDGTFGNPTTYSSGSGADPQYAVVGDFNGDGKPDLAISNDNATVAVMLGNGDGTFQPAMTFLVPQAANQFVMGDFNQDGKLDVAVLTNGVSLLLGNGDGTLQAAQSISSLPAYSVVAGDFNNDGKLDLATTAEGEEEVRIYLGNGDGTFQAPLITPSGNANSFFITTADVNRDGKLDIMIQVGVGSDNSAEVFLGNGDGTFQSYVEYPTGTFPVA